VKNLEISKLNWALLIVVGALVVIGVVNLYSALKVWGETGFSRLVWLQMLWILIGSVFCVSIAFSDYRLLEKLSTPLYIFTLALLAATIIFGREIMGHKSWLGVGGVGIQPSEFAKIVIIISLSKYFADHPHPEGFNFVGLLKPLIITLIPTAIIIMQGDFGSALFLLLSFATFALFAKVKRSVILLVLIASLAAGVFGYYHVLSDYQRARITTFLNPDYDVKGSGYHIAQSRIAVGSGRIFGKGYLGGNINKLRYLPEKHTDFVFPVLAEEWGFAGCVVVLGFYYALLSMALEIARHARDRLGIFIAIGVCGYFFWQIVINVYGVLGLMPLTGVTLPFLSYGGSATVSTLAAIGLLLSVSRKRFVF